MDIERFNPWNPEMERRKVSGKYLCAIYLLGLLATFFTNLEAVPFMSTLSMLSCCVLAQALERLWIFCLALIPIGAMMGLSTWGYLQEAALAICVVLQIPLFLAYWAHRRLTTRHPELWSVTLAFPCVATALWVLSFMLLPIGSTGSPAYSMAGQNLMFIQCCAWLGRSFVNFLLCWLASAGAHRLVNPKSGFAFKASVACYFLLTLAGGLRVYADSLFMGLDFIPPGGEASEPHHISCIAEADDMFATTKERLAQGDTIVMHAERSTDGDDPVASYQTLLQQHFDKQNVEALMVLSFVENDLSWYHLVSRHGSQMSYAKNHPVPFVEEDISAGRSPPSVAKVTVDGAPLSVTGTICFDTDFPFLTRSLSSGDLLLESSATWSNIGHQHLRGHQYAAVENGQTLVKCTLDGYTGAINPYGSIVFQAPQTTGVVSFELPRVPKLTTFPLLYLGFEVIVGFAALIWILLAASPQLSIRWLGRCHLLPPGRLTESDEQLTTA